MSEQMQQQGFLSPFSPAYWRSAAAQIKKPRMLTLTALFVALRIVVGMVPIPLGDNLHIFFTFFVNALGSAIYGPLLGLISGFSADLLGFILQPTGPFFPGYLLSSMLGSFFYGLFFYRARINGVRVLLAKLVVNLGVNVGLGALWSALLYGKGYLYTVTASILKNVVLLPLETAVMVLVFRAVHPLLTRLALIPAQARSAIPWIARKGVQRQ